MKNYRFLVPIVMVVLLLLSVYSLADQKAKDQAEYAGYLEEAREYRQMGIYVDSKAFYEAALAKKPSLDLYLELGSLHEEFNQTRAHEYLVEDLLGRYPENAETYEFAVKFYVSRKDYGACFNTASTMKKRGLNSKAVEDMLAQIEYAFYLVSTYEDVGVFGRGMCPIRIENRWGYVTESGSQSVPARYTIVGEYSAEGIAPVVDTEGNAYFIDKQGNKKRVVLNVENVQQLGMMEAELFALYNGENWGFYNTDGVQVFGGYEAVSNIGNGVAACMQNGKWTIRDAKGTDLTGKTYEGVLMDEKKIVYRNERLFVYTGEGYQLIDVSGKVQSKAVYQDARLFGDATYAAVRMGDLWGFVDRDGKVVLEAKYEDARSFSNGFAAVKVDGKWGFIDLDGKMVIEPQFGDAKDFTSLGTVYVYTGRDWEMLKLFKYNH